MFRSTDKSEEVCRYDTDCKHMNKYEQVTIYNSSTNENETTLEPIKLYECCDTRINVSDPYTPIAGVCCHTEELGVGATILLIFLWAIIFACYFGCCCYLRPKIEEIIRRFRHKPRLTSDGVQTAAAMKVLMTNDPNVQSGGQPQPQYCKSQNARKFKLVLSFKKFEEFYILYKQA